MPWCRFTKSHTHDFRPARAVSIDYTPEQGVQNVPTPVFERAKALGKAVAAKRPEKKAEQQEAVVSPTDGDVKDG